MDKVNLEQCPGCPEGYMYVDDGVADGCAWHSTAAMNARSRDPQMGGGNLPVDEY